MNNTEKTMDKIVALCKNRGFVFPGSEIYGGLANTWDYGPLGAELKKNIKNAWWKKFVQENPYNVGLDAAILMNPQTWVASIMSPDSLPSAMMMIELMCEEDVAAVLKGRYSMVCTDGFPSQGKCHPRYTASFIRVLEKYVRQERLLTLPEAIQKMTGLPAKKLGLPDRGRIAPGCKADLLLLNPERIHGTADYDHPDGLAQGLEIVMINGVLAMEQGKSTGVCAGRVLHRNRAEK